jgi:hypothetical protein
LIFERRKLVRGAAVVLAFAMVIAFRVVYASIGELALGDAALANEDREVAIAHYRRTIRWYAPFSPFPVRAINRLERLASLSETEGDAVMALACHRSIRAGIMSTRSTFTPHTEALDRANRNIARLMASGPRPPMDAARERASLEAEHLRLLRDVERPSLPLVVLALFGFVLWVGAAFTFGERAIDDDDRIIRRSALRIASVFALGFLLFVVGLRFA